MKKKVKLANFNDPKWTYNDLKKYARKYYAKLNEMDQVPDDIKKALFMYQCLTKENLITQLKKVQAFLY